MPTRSRKPAPAAAPPAIAVNPITAPILAPLSALVQTDLNARRVNAAEGIEELADSIAQHGLLASLDVVPSADLFETWEVVGGGRRLRALEMLAARGVIEPDAPIPVVVGDRIDGRAISIEENVRRLPMNPADEFEAYRLIVAEMAGEEDPIAACARRFQRPRSHVEGRLRLARLAPEILDALRDETIGIEAARAYAAVDDVALQRAVFAGEKDRTYGQRHAPAQIRDALNMRTAPAAGMLATYVGLDAYTAAGGRTDRDFFFTADAGERILDPSLLQQLAQAKALAELPAVVTRDGFAGGMLTPALNETPAWPKVPPGYERSPVGAKPEDLPRSRRKDVTAIYTLPRDGSGLIAIGYVTPVPTPPAPAAAAPPDTPPRPAPDLARLDRAVAETDGSADAARADRQRTQRLRYAAAHIAAEQSFSAELADRLSWPAEFELLPAVTEESEETILVTVQIRVPRAEWEAALPAVEQLLDEEAA